MVTGATAQTPEQLMKSGQYARLQEAVNKMAGNNARMAAEILKTWLKEA